MTSFLELLVAALCLYLPGRAWFPLFLERTSGPALPISRLVVEVATSTAGATFVSLLLLDLGAFSLATLGVVLAAWALLGWILARNAPRFRYGRTDLAVVGVFVLGLLWLSPPMSAHFAGADGTAYLAAGAAGARTGTLVRKDPSVLALDPDARRAFFPSVAADRGSPPYVRLEGGLILRDLESGDVLPAFQAGLIPWLALGASWLGTERMVWIVPFFAASALGTLYALLRTFTRSSAALLGTLLLAVQAPFVFYGRFPQPEAGAAFFLLSGLYAFVMFETGYPAASALVGLAFGAAGLFRMEMLFLLPAGLWWAWLHLAISRVARVAIATAPFCGAALARAAWFRTHYWGNLETFASDHAVLLGILFGVAGTATALRLWKGALRTSHVLSPFVLGGVLALGAFQLSSSARWLIEASGALLFLGVSGWFHIFARGRGLPAPFTMCALATLGTLAFCLYVFAPNAAPVPWWVLRRSVPVLLPCLAIGAAILLASASHRRVAAPLLAASAVVALAAFSPASRSLHRSGFFSSAATHAKAVSHLFPNRCIAVVEPKLAPLGLPLWLWAERDCGGYYIPADDCERLRTLTSSTTRSSPVYLVTAGDRADHCSGTQFRIVPVARYEFALRNPLEETAGLHVASGERPGFRLYELSVYLLRTRGQ